MAARVWRVLETPLAGGVSASGGCSAFSAGLINLITCGLTAAHNKELPRVSFLRCSFLKLLCRFAFFVVADQNTHLGLYRIMTISEAGQTWCYPSDLHPGKNEKSAWQRCFTDPKKSHPSKKNLKQLDVLSVVKMQVHENWNNALVKCYAASWQLRKAASVIAHRSQRAALRTPAVSCKTKSFAAECPLREAQLHDVPSSSLSLWFTASALSFKPLSVTDRMKRWSYCLVAFKNTWAWEDPARGLERHGIELAGPRCPSRRRDHIAWEVSYRTLVGNIIWLPFICS